MTVLTIETKLPRVEAVGIGNRLDRFVALIVTGQPEVLRDRLYKQNEDERQSDEERNRDEIALFHATE
jgi:hypothetical protein